MIQNISSLFVIFDANSWPWQKPYTTNNNGVHGHDTSSHVSKSSSILKYLIAIEWALSQDHSLSLSDTRRIEASSCMPSTAWYLISFNTASWYSLLFSMTRLRKTSLKNLSIPTHLMMSPFVMDSGPITRNKCLTSKISFLRFTWETCRSSLDIHTDANSSREELLISLTCGESEENVTVLCVIARFWGIVEKWTLRLVVVFPSITIDTDVHCLIYLQSYLILFFGVCEDSRNCVYLYFRIFLMSS